MNPIKAGIALVLAVALGAVSYFVLFRGEDAPQEGPPPEPRMSEQQSHATMLRALGRLADISGAEHPYLSDGAALRVRREIENRDPKMPAEDLCALYFRAGIAEARLGNLRASIDNLQRARELIEPAKLPKEVANYIRFKLGVAYLRLGETENCCTAHGPDSCIVPIRASGIHAKTEGSTKAIELFEEVLRSGSTGVSERTDGSTNSSARIRVDLASRWLLNVAHMTLGQYPDAVPEEWRIGERIFESSVPFPRFVNVAERAGLDTFNLCGGVIIDDFDNDGYLDVVTSTWDPRGQLRFYRNRADGGFEDRTEQAGLRGIFGGLNIVQTDFDNDGNLDVLVLRGAWLGSFGRHPNSLLRNTGDGRFVDVTFSSGLGVAHYPTQTAAWADYDNDGDLDLFVGNEHTGEVRAPCQLFRNNGNRTFTEVAGRAGVQNLRFTKGVCFGDFDGDRLPDIYVSNYNAPNRLYKNNGDGTFSDVAAERGVDAPVVSFPTWFFDYDNDGALDLFVASYTGRVDNLVGHYLGQAPDYDPSRLYRGDGRGGFEDVTERVGLRVPMLPMGANFGDLDNDGFLDFYLGTGDPEYESLMPNMMFLNQGGERFVDVTMAGGFGHLQKGHGVAFADLDNDGDADVFEQMGGAFAGDKFADALFENPGFGNHWITVQLVGTNSNRAAIGARIHVRVTDGGRSRSIYRHVNSGGSFGASPLRQTIGLGAATKIDSIEVFWPTTGKTQRFDKVPFDKSIRIVEGAGSFEELELKRLRLGG